MSDHQLRHLGAAGEDGRRSVPARRQESLRLQLPVGLGWAARRCTTSPIFPASFRTTSRSRASTIAPTIGRSRTTTLHPLRSGGARHRRLRDAKAEEPWRPAGKPYPMPPMKTFRHGEVWLKGFESVGIRTVPAAVGMNRPKFWAVPPASMTAGATSAVRSGRLPTRT